MGTSRRSLLVKVLTHSITSRAININLKAEQVHLWVTKYCTLCDYDVSEMEKFCKELEQLNDGNQFQSSGVGLIVTLPFVRASLNESIPQLLSLLQRDMPVNLERIARIEWRSLFGIGIQVTSGSPDSSPPSTSR